MDYKELLEQLTDEDNCNVLDYIDDAVTAITELLERAQKAEQERDAAVRDINLVLRQEYYLPCIACKNSRDGEPCEGLQLEGFTCRANAGWRGVQEE